MASLRFSVYDAANAVFSRLLNGDCRGTLQQACGDTAASRNENQRINRTARISLL
jgi:hypothetical protein